MTSAEATGAAAPPRRRTWTRRLGIAAAVAGVGFVYVHAWQNTDVNLPALVSGFHNLVRIVGEMFPPDWSIFWPSVNAAIVTFDTALLGTTFAFLVAIVLAPLAARNITPHRLVYEVCRALMGIARTIPLWVSGLLFLVTVGISPFAGVLALALETVGVLAKLYAAEDDER